MLENRVVDGLFVGGGLEEIGIGIIAVSAALTIAAVQSVFLREVMIDAHVELVVGTWINQLGREIAKSLRVAGLVGWRKEIEHLRTDGVPQGWVNEVPCDGGALAILAGGGRRACDLIWVVKLPSRGEQLGKIADAFGHGRN